MSACDRRTFVQTAALVSLLTSVLAASSAEAAGQAGYFVIAEVVAKPGSADELRAPLVPFAEKSRTPLHFTFTKLANRRIACGPQMTRLMY